MDNSKGEQANLIYWIFWTFIEKRRPVLSLI